MSINWTAEVTDGDAEAVANSIRVLLAQNSLTSVATVTPSGAPHINVCYYGPTPSLELVLFTAPNSRHGINLAADGSFGATVFDSSQSWGGMVYGAQFFGVGKLAADADKSRVLQSYIQHNPGMAEWAQTPEDIELKFESRLYVLTINEFTLLDEATFGKEAYISGRILRGA